MPPYEIYNLQQNSPEWLAWRETGLGASDAATIMGENPWRTREQLMAEKLNPPPFQSNEACEVGHALEPLARRYYEERTSYKVAPACLRSRLWPWLLASLDGFSADGLHAVEIKCGLSAYTKTAERMRVPDHYKAQVQQQLAVTGLLTMDFWAFWPGRPRIGLHVKRNDAFVERLVAETERFWRELQAAKGAT